MIVRRGRYFIPINSHVSDLLPLTKHGIKALTRLPRHRLQVVLRRGETTLAMCLKKNLLDGAGRLGTRRNRLHPLQVPEAHRAIRAASRQQKLIRMKLQAVHRARVALEINQQLARLQVPYLHQSVVAHRRDPLAVGTEAKKIEIVKYINTYTKQCRKS